jgi:hypothetical protein
VRPFPIVVDAWTVYVMRQRQDERTRQKNVARHQRRKARGK